MIAPVECGFQETKWLGANLEGCANWSVRTPECHAKEFGFYPAGNEDFSTSLHSILCTFVDRPAFGEVSATVAVGLECARNKWV